LKEVIIADEEVIISTTDPEWHLIQGDTDIEWLIDFNTTKRLVFKMGNGKTYYFSLVRVEDD